jgi:nicotinate dehydrogenase subunit A
VNVSFRLNGRDVTLNVDDPAMPLLYALRDDFELHGPRFGSGLGQCGACTVLLDNTAVRSCITPVSNVAGKQVTTLEGLGTPDKLHPLQRAFIKEQAAQYALEYRGTYAPRAVANRIDTEVRSALDRHPARMMPRIRSKALVQLSLI